MININNTTVIIEIYQNKTFILLLKQPAKIVMKNHFGMFHSRLPLYRLRAFKSQTARRKAKKKKLTMVEKSGNCGAFIESTAES